VECIKKLLFSRDLSHIDLYTGAMLVAYF